jgi:hypothetical protein
VSNPAKFALSYLLIDAYLAGHFPSSNHHYHFIISNALVMEYYGIFTEQLNCLTLAVGLPVQKTSSICLKKKQSCIATNMAWIINMYMHI